MFSRGSLLNVATSMLIRALLLHPSGHGHLDIHNRAWNLFSSLNICDLILICAQ